MILPSCNLLCSATAMGRRAWLCSMAAGACAAALFTVSPLGWCVAGLAAGVLPRLLMSSDAGERRIVTAIIGAAIVARLLAIDALFLRQLAVHDDQFAGATSGDES